MSENTGTAQTPPGDFVREFLKQLAHPETRLHTDTRSSPDDVWSGTNWGDAGKAAIRDVLSQALARRDLQKSDDN